MKALKEKIENEKGKDGFPAAGQKLIYAGSFAKSKNVHPDMQMRFFLLLNLWVLCVSWNLCCNLVHELMWFVNRNV